MDELIVKKAGLAELEDAAILFDRYRQFYGKAADLDSACDFLRERLLQQESVVFIAYSDEKAVGFTQLYPSFSSLSLGRIFILNDLFVAPEARRKKVGSQLLDAATAYGREVGAIRMALSTALTNSSAQALYEGKGWIRDKEFCEYSFSL